MLPWDRSPARTRAAATGGKREDWRVLAHAGHRVPVAHLRGQPLRTPVRSPYADPAHPVDFGVDARGGDDADRVVQFAAFAFDDAVRAVADSPLAGSAGDDAGEAVWRALTQSPIADLCREDLAAALGRATLADGAGDCDGDGAAAAAGPP